MSTQQAPVQSTTDGRSAASQRASVMAQRLFALGIASVFTGVVIGGIGGRIAMRIGAAAAPDFAQGVTTDAGARVGEITLEGTIGLIFFVGVFSGLFGWVTVAAAETWMPRKPVVRASLLGVVFLAVVGPEIIEPDSIDFFILRPVLLNVAMFAALPLLFGVLVVPVADRVEGLLGRAKQGSTSGLAPFLVAGAMVVFSIPVVAEFLSEDFCQCRDPSRATGLLLLGVLLSSGAAWTYHVVSGRPILLVLRLTGTASLVGVSVLGLVRLVDHISRVV